MYLAGQPSPPVILSLTPMALGKLSLTWSQPYSPPNIILMYTVTITEVNPDNGVRVGRPQLVILHNLTSFIFMPADQTCNEFIFTVQAENQAGSSETSRAATGTLPVG